MLIKLPIDIWRDIFEWLFPNRKELAIKFNEFGDYQFNDICQKWLHEWTKSVCLENLRISPPPAKWTRIGGRLESANTESALLQCWGWGYQSDALPFAESELPENIVHFQEIHCRYLDTAVLQFFHRMQPLFMRKVNMEILTRGNRHTLRAARTTLDHLMPLLGGGIEDFGTDDSELIFTVRDRFPAQFFGIKRLLLFTVLYEDLYTVELLPKLLSLVCTRREDGQPWVLEMPAFCANAPKLVKRIRQHFLKATGPASFFIRAQGPFRGIPESITQNAITGEQLVTLAPRDNLLIIGRCLPLPALDGLTWAKEVEKKCRAAKKLHFPGLCRRKISIVFPKLGPIELEESEQEDGEDDDDVDQPRPSSSKKPRLSGTE